MSIVIATTTWLRFPERLEYLKLMIKSVRQNLIFQGDISWLISCESQKNVDGILPELERLCSDQEIELHFKLGEPNHSKNRNQILALCEEKHPNKHIFYLQDDWELIRPLDLTPDKGFLTVRKGVGMIRYFVANHENPKYLPDFERLPLWRELDRSTRYYYCDGPHLRQPLYHKETGPYLETVSSDGKDLSPGENDMNTRAKVCSSKILVRYPGDYFTHDKRRTTLVEKWESHNKALSKRKQ
jgi:hypothetical protein